MIQTKNYPEAAEIAKLLDGAHKVLILQADNPDGDSLGSALALEHIIGDMDKEPYLYCGIDMPDYLHYLKGWDRVSKDFPKDFDLSIIVDTSSDDLFESVKQAGVHGQLSKRPCIVLDHHEVKKGIPYATVSCNHPVVATGEVIYELAQALDWPLNTSACEMLSSSIMSDSLGLTSEGTTARSIHIMGELVEKGVSLAKLESERRELMRKSAELLHYKGDLLKRIEYSDDLRVATIVIPWPEIKKYSPLYNPSMLVIEEMRQSVGTDVAIAFKTYQDGRITAKLRSNYGKGVCAQVAEHFGGGGHRYASGFKVTDGRSIDQIKSETVTLTQQLLDKLEQTSAKTDEAA